MISRSFVAAFVATGVLAGASAAAQDTIKIAYIDPLSGPGATVGEVGLKTFQFLADELNAKGGAAGKKFEILPFDNKTNPQESLVQVQKAVDAGARIITQGNGSSVAAALSDWVAKYNERNPGKEVIYLNYAAVDPVLTNDKCTFLALPLGRQLRHQDGGPDQLHEGPEGHQEGLPDQPGLFVRPGRAQRPPSRC